MSFVAKLKQNKQMIAAVISGIAVGYIFYKLVERVPKIETAHRRRKRQLQLLRRQINVDNPSFDDVKKVMAYAIHEAKIKVAKFSKQFREKRMKFNGNVRKQNFKEYLSLIEQGTEELQMIAIRQQHELLKDLKISEVHFKKYNKLLDDAMQEIMKVESQDISHITPMNLEDAKFAFRQQIHFIKSEGLEYADLIIEATRGWPAEKKANLPELLSVVITDAAFQNYPQINADSVEYASIQYEKQLMGELQDLQTAMAPMMIRLSAAIKEGNGFGFTDLQDDQERMGYEQTARLSQFQRSGTLFTV